jgi:crotonobetainyl-CoA:carnitine CoA-transferase CaiB-like acyl-CoA transferase
VIKIEPPKRGDATRLIAKQPGYHDSALHRRWNRGKRSLALDTTTPEGQAVLRRLIPTVDVVIEGLRPGTLDKMGLGWDELTSLKPDLVVISLSGYGQSGPYRDLPSHGIAFDAVSGLARSRTTAPGGGSRRTTCTTARCSRRSSAPRPCWRALSWSGGAGKPVRLDVAQADVAAFANRDRGCRGRAGAPRGRAGERRPPVPAGVALDDPAYRTRDGACSAMALERKFFVRLAGRSVARICRAGSEDQYMVRTTPEIDERAGSPSRRGPRALDGGVRGGRRPRRPRERAPPRSTIRSCRAGPSGCRRPGHGDDEDAGHAEPRPPRHFRADGGW